MTFSINFKTKFNSYIYVHNRSLRICSLFYFTPDVRNLMVIQHQKNLSVSDRADRELLSLRPHRWSVSGWMLQTPPPTPPSPGKANWLAADCAVMMRQTKIFFWLPLLLYPTKFAVPISGMIRLTCEPKFGSPHVCSRFVLNSGFLVSVPAQQSLKYNGVCAWEGSPGDWSEGSRKILSSYARDFLYVG